MSRSVDRVRDYFRGRQLPVEVRELDHSTRTAPLAAAAVGVELGQIVKSLVFVDAEGRTLLALVAGDRRADPDKVARAAGAAFARIANAEEVRARTGYAIGGVPPVAHESGRIARTLIDESLGRFRIVWAAAGAPNAVFPISHPDLVALTEGTPADITETTPS